MPRAYGAGRILALMAAMQAAGLPAVFGAQAPEVAIVRGAAWSPGDPVREGAGEFEVLMTVAKVLQEHSRAAIVGIGDSHGLFADGTERALRFVAFHGVPVVTLASGGRPTADPEGIFLDGGNLTAAQASAVIQRCLEHFGPPPFVADPEHPTAGELAALRASLSRYQAALARAALR